MRDLRKKILLESGKTTSRKARAKADSNFGSTNQSPSSTPANSRPGSRAPSRYASEDEGFSDSDITDSSLVLSTADEEVEAADWERRLQDAIKEILDRKNSSTKGRESYLAAYTWHTRHHYADEIVENSLHELVPSILRSIKGGRNAEETTMALKALTMTTLTTQSEDIYDPVLSSLKSVCQDSGEESVKIEAIHAMTVVTLFGGLEGAMTDLMDFFLEIVESDGHNIEAGDNGPVVTAALMAWGFLATHVDNLTDDPEQAIDAFLEQLDSSDVDVQLAAGTNLALIMEVIRKHNEMAEQEHWVRQESRREQARLQGIEGFEAEEFNPYDLQYNKHQLLTRVESLERESSKAISKKGRRKLHATFQSIRTSLEHGMGPGYSTAGRVARASDRDGERVYDSEKVFGEFGYRDSIKVQVQGGGRPRVITISVDSWSFSIRIAFLKKLIGGGFGEHWTKNPAVSDLFGGD